MGINKYSPGPMQMSQVQGKGRFIVVVPWNMFVSLKFDPQLTMTANSCILKMQVALHE